jgi:cold shock CspA family protein
MPYGTLKRWNADRGFGFISDDQQPHKNWSFVHIRNMPRDHMPVEGDAYSYDIAMGRDGRDQAVDLKALSPERTEVDRVFGYDD